jgi:hypothetical protein
MEYEELEYLGYVINSEFGEKEDKPFQERNVKAFVSDTEKRLKLVIGERSITLDTKLRVRERGDG